MAVERTSRILQDRRLILMRHATASFDAASDAMRPLSDRGREEAISVGDRLRRLGWKPDRVACSVARRCRETWDGVSKAFEEEIPIEFEKALYHAGPRALLEAIAGSEASQTLLVLAHNPGISVLAFELGGENDSEVAWLRKGFSPATFACFGVQGPWSQISRRTVRLLHLERPHGA
jgi:phosphohistidine phosphatase